MGADAWKYDVAVVPDNFVIAPIDNTPPVLISVLPADDSTNVPVNTNLTLVFSEAVKGFPGSIEIHKSDGTTVANIPTLDTNQVTYSGSTVTVNPTNDLAPGTDYYIQITPESIQDLAGNKYAGLTSTTRFNFRTASPAPAPTLNLTASITSVDTTALQPGGQVAVHYSISNSGTASAGAQNVGFYLSADQTITTGDIFLGQAAIGSIGANTASPLIATLSVPSNVPNGTYFLGVIADYDHHIPETNENDNASTNGPSVTVGFQKITVAGSTEMVIARDDNGQIIADLSNQAPVLGLLTQPTIGYTDIGFAGSIDNMFMPGTYTLEGAHIVQQFADNAGNNTFWAKGFGALFNDNTVGAADYVTRIDGLDFYKFTLTRPSAVAITLATQNSMFDTTAARLVFDDADSFTAGGFTHYLPGSSQQFRDLQTTANNAVPLPAGTYYFHVDHPIHYNVDLLDTPADPFDRELQNYTVHVTAWDDNAGNNAEHAANLGTINNTSLTTPFDSINIADPEDWYKFNVSSASSVTISVSSSNPNWTVGLEFARFNPVDLSILPATNSFLAFAQSDSHGNPLPLGPDFVQLDPGVDYYVRVFGKLNFPLLDGIDYNHFAYPDGGSTEYQLTVHTTTVPPGAQPDITGDPGPNLILGSTAASTIRGMGGGDTVYAGGGDDTVVGAGGNNTYEGGSGVNTLDYSAAPSAVSVDLSAGTAQNGFGGNDHINDFQAVLGTPLADHLFGDIHGNTLSGNAGDDSIFGNGGSDILRGGEGNDTLVGNDDIFASVADTLDGGDGNDQLYGEPTDTVSGGAGTDTLFAVNANPWTINLGTTSIEQMLAGFGNDHIDASSQTTGVTVFAGGGNDAVTGSQFGDFLWGGAGDDVLIGGNGDDLLFGDVGADQLSGGAGNDVIYADGADTFIDGGAGFDAVYWTPGSNAHLDLAADAAEFAQSFGGNDIINGTNSLSDLIIFAGAGNDTISGGQGNDFLWGEAGNDVIVGGSGNDTLVGGTGADNLTGGSGTDDLYGNGGAGGDGAADDFVFTANSGTDFVYDFEHGIDKLDLTALHTTFASVTISSSNGNADVNVGADHIIVVHQAGHIDQADFLF